MGSMKDQFGDTPAPYPNGPGHRGVPTSVAAAASMRPHVAAAHRTILAFLVEQGERGGTYREIMAGTGMGAPTVCGRMVELVQSRRVRIGPETRLTPSGRKARVYLVREAP